ncbi:MAG: glycosyltransferase [Burkholderiaceae bacterium]|nr:glycosyltransferase [Burkholderiaceae bacterium]
MAGERAPRVAIGMPAFNAERHIAAAIESLLGQTFGDFELIVSDNASTDATEQICRAYAARDRRLRYVRQPANVGGPANFRHVFSLARAPFFKWATADDLWAPTFLEKCVAVLERRPDVVLCHSDAFLIDDAGRPTAEYDDPVELMEDDPRARFLRLLRTIRLCHAQLGVIRHAAMRRTALMGNQRNSDTHFLAELSLYGKFHKVPERLFFRRLHPGASSWQREDDARQDAYYTPGRHPTRRLDTWSKYAHLMGAVRRAPLSWTDRLRLHKDLLRFALWERHRLRAEAATLLRPSRF